MRLQVSLVDWRLEEPPGSFYGTSPRIGEIRETWEKEWDIWKLGRMGVGLLQLSGTCSRSGLDWIGLGSGHGMLLYLRE